MSLIKLNSILLQLEIESDAISSHMFNLTRKRALLLVIERQKPNQMSWFDFNLKKFSLIVISKVVSFHCL